MQNNKHHQNLLISLIFVFLFIAKTPLSAQSFEWVRAFETENGQLGSEDCIADDNGNVYFLGKFRSTIDLDAGPGSNIVTALDSLGTPWTSGFILKSDSTGNHLWGKRIGGKTGYSVDFTSIAIDQSGSAIISGIFAGTVDFDPGPGVFELSGPPIGSARQVNGFVMKLDENGVFSWARSLGTTTNYAEYKDLAIDSSGAVNLVGFFNDTLDFDPGPAVFELSRGAGAGFVQKLDANGDFVWASTLIRGSGSISPISLSLDLNQNSYIVGAIGGTVIFDTDSGIDTLTRAGNSNVFICKLNPSGNVSWVRHLTPGHVISTDTKVDNNGDLIISGNYFVSGTDYDPGPGIVTLPGIVGFGVSAYILKLDSDGNFIWVISNNGEGNSISQISLDSDNNIYASGDFRGAVDFDPGIGVNALQADPIGNIFVQKIDPFGNLIWVFQMGSPNQEISEGLAIDNKKNVFISGSFVGGTMDLDPGPGVVNLTNTTGPNQHDQFLLKYSQGICDDLVLAIDSVDFPDCTNMGAIYTRPSGGLAPYTYNWSLDPNWRDSIAVINTGGIYEVSITDANSCYKTTEFFIPGPSVQNGFDLQANLVTTDFRTGFESFIWLNASNDGCVPVSGSVHVILDSLISFKSSSLMPDQISGDTLSWDLLNINFDVSQFLSLIKVETSLSAAIGDTICIKVLILPEVGDFDSTNNARTYCYPVVNSYDPNDKQVSPSGPCPENFVLLDQKLTYTIRFQNTGNADAINIFLLDTLSSDLEINSLKILGKSHEPMITEFLPGNILKFRFDNINLPDSMSNEAQSHGYVVFEISPKENLPIGTVISNSAAIYFDFNPPIITNTVISTYTDSIPDCLTTSIPTLYNTDKLLIFPNPGSNFLRIKGEFTPNSYAEILSIDGRIILKEKIKDNQLEIDALTKGVYFLRIHDQDKIYTQKFIKN